jgi:hypothetical protein
MIVLPVLFKLAELQRQSFQVEAKIFDVPWSVFRRGIQAFELPAALEELDSERYQTRAASHRSEYFGHFVSRSAFVMEKLKVVKGRESFQGDVLNEKAIVRGYGEAERSPAWKR